MARSKEPKALLREVTSIPEAMKNIPDDLKSEIARALRPKNKKLTRAERKLRSEHQAKVWYKYHPNHIKEKWISVRICQATYDKLEAAKKTAGAASWSAVLKTIFNAVYETGIIHCIDGDHAKEPKRFIRIPESIVKSFERIEPGEFIDDKIYLATCSFLKVKRRS